MRTNKPFLLFVFLKQLMNSIGEKAAVSVMNCIPACLIPLPLVRLSRMKKSILTILVIGILLPMAAQAGKTPDYQAQLYTAYVKEEMSLWKDIIGQMDREYMQSKNGVLLYDLCFAYYGYIGYLINIKDNDAAKREVNKALERTKTLLLVSNDRDDILALHGALLGYQIVLSKFKSPLLGPLAMREIKQAQNSAHIYFNCNVEMGNMLFFSPRYLGGSKKKALAYYEKAVQILEEGTLKQDRHWIYMNTVLLLANAYMETGRKEKASLIYKQLLEYEPRATWIRSDLLFQDTKTH